MILITTAGKVGSEAASLLAQRGTPVRVLVRSLEKAKALVQARVELVEGDLDNPATIDAALRDVKAVVLVSPAVPVQELNVIDSAVRAGVAHVVKITSKASADSPIARRRWQTEIEAGLIASGLGYPPAQQRLHAELPRTRPRDREDEQLRLLRRHRACRSHRCA